MLTTVSFFGCKLMSTGCSPWLRQVALGTQLELVISGGSWQEKRQQDPDKPSASETKQHPLNVF